jgi:site-specific DNA-methyltransferase (adenine-specific)
VTQPTVIILGDNRWTLKRIPSASIDAVVCDPPYGLSKEPDMAEVLKHWLAGDDYEATGGGFMGKSWDSFVPGPATWREVLRVLKPGGHCLAFAGARTVDLMGLALRLGGFEIRDCLSWLYGSGFPKSLDVSKAIDKAAGAEREVTRAATREFVPGDAIGWDQRASTERERRDNPATAAAAAWAGWGTALKPAWEPIIVARKPLVGTVAANVLEHGTGAINVDGCRIATLSGESIAPMAGSATLGGTGEGWDRPWKNNPAAVAAREERARAAIDKANTLGRWPANVVLDEVAAELLDEQTGTSKSGQPRPDRGEGGIWPQGNGVPCGPQYGDSGGASRFFYVAKASKSERNAGCEHLEPQFAPTMGNGIGGKEHDPETATKKQNTHPTVKPVALMRWLVRLVTPPGGVVLDPFLGSGTTGIAAVAEGFGFVGMEQSAEYVAIADARIRHHAAESGRDVNVIDFNSEEGAA